VPLVLPVLPVLLLLVLLLQAAARAATATLSADARSSAVLLTFFMCWIEPTTVGLDGT
jgi:hypothetical protein